MVEPSFSARLPSVEPVVLGCLCDSTTECGPTGGLDGKVSG